MLEPKQIKPNLGKLVYVKEPRMYMDGNYILYSGTIMLDDYGKPVYKVTVKEQNRNCIITLDPKYVFEIPQEQPEPF